MITTTMLFVKGDKWVIDILGSTRDLQSIQADAHFKYKGLSFFGEYANRVATDGGPINELNEIYHTGSALNLQTGYLFKNNWDISREVYSSKFRGRNWT